MQIVCSRSTLDHENSIKITGSLLPPANEVWGKVIFSEASFILFTRGDLPARGVWSVPEGVSACSGVCIQGVQVWIQDLVKGGPGF